jgi:hypothetical protein
VSGLGVLELLMTAPARSGIVTEIADNRQAVVSRLLDVLIASRNPDGSWGYLPGKAGRLEPTSWAMLALLDCGVPRRDVDQAAAVAVLSRWQRPGGLLADVPHVSPNLAFNGLAALALRRMRELEPAALFGHERVEADLLGGITATKGIRTAMSDVMRQDNRLQGWPWIDATFSWVEPTAWCLLALKRARRDMGSVRLEARIDEADRLLIDRCCKAGGWNYGNSNVFEQDLHPYAPTTAVALMALQDRRNALEVTRSLEWMTANATQEISGMALSLALLTAVVYRRLAEPIEQLLCDDVLQTGLLGNLATVSMAAVALTWSRHEAAALTV